MRAFITGACGFVGGYLARHLLQKGDQVLGAVLPASLRPAGSPADFEFESVELDVTDAAAAARTLARFRPEVIYHLAGLAFVPECENDFSRALLINVGGTANLYRIAHGLQSAITVVLVSSSEVYGKVSECELPITEDSPARPSNNYSLSKLMAELVAERYSRHGNLRSVIMRPFNHIGPGQNNRFVTSSFAYQLARIAKGRAPAAMKVGNLSVQRDFSDVRDIVRAYRLGAERGAGTYNLGSGKTVSIEEVLEMLIGISGLQVKIERDPELMRPAENPCVYGSLEKARRELGWQPEIEIKETLKNLYDYWLERV